MTPEVVPQGGSLTCQAETVNVRQDVPMSRSRTLIGLLWIVTYYVTGQDLTLPLFTDLGQYNLMVGIGFMAVGFSYATRWE